MDEKARVLIFLVIFSTSSSLYAIEENQGWPIDWYMNQSCPLIIDLDGNGSMDVIMGTAIRDSLGAWNFDGQPLAGWPISIPHEAFWEIAGGDIDNDGRIEVVIAVFDTSSIALALRSDASQPEGWPFEVPSWATVAPSLFDLNGDGQLEILIASSDTGAGDAGNGTRFGRLGVYSAHGEILSGWPFLVTERLLDTTPSIADIDMDGDFEIVFATYEHGFHGPAWIHVFNHDGTPFADSTDFKQVEKVIGVTPVSLVDIHGDIRPEIIASDDDGLVHILDNNADYIPGWPQAEPQGRMSDMPVAIGARNGPAQFLWGESDAGRSFIYDSEGNLLPDWPYYGDMMRSQPIVGDLDGEENDATPEAFLGGSNPYNVVLDFYAEYPEGWPVYTDGNDFGTGALTDLDGDGDTDIIFLDYSGNIHAYDTPGVYRHDLIECPRYMYDNWHTGAYHKDLYREAESAREIIGWTTVHDTTAWGHYCLRPVTSDSRNDATGSSDSDQVQTGAASDRMSLDQTAFGPQDLYKASPGHDATLEPAHFPDSHPASYILTYRAQVPVWKNYHVWVRVRKLAEKKLDFSPEVTLDGEALQRGGAVENSPGGWLWHELGDVPIKPGSHEFKITLGRCRRDVDRILFTTHNSLPLLDESPHEWQTPCPGCELHIEQHQLGTEAEEPADKRPTLLSKLGNILAGLKR